MHRILFLSLVLLASSASAQLPDPGTQVLLDPPGDLQATVDGTGASQSWPGRGHDHLDVEGVWFAVDPERGLQVTLDLLALQDPSATPLHSGWGQLDLEVAGERFGLYVWLTPGSALDGDGRGSAYNARVLHDGDWHGDWLEVAVDPPTGFFVTWVPLSRLDLTGDVMVPGADVEVVARSMATWDFYQHLRIHDDAPRDEGASPFVLRVPGAGGGLREEPAQSVPPPDGREAPGLAWWGAPLAWVLARRTARTLT